MVDDSAETKEAVRKALHVPRKLYVQLAMSLQAVENCRRFKNLEWETRHGETIETLVKNYMPSGSGFDAGTKLDRDKSTPDKLVFNTSFHHMNDAGFYTYWTEHWVIVMPSLMSGFDLRITGRDRNDIKDYIHDVFASALDAEV